MIASSAIIDQSARRLLEHLEQDRRHIERSLEYLDRLRSLLIKRQEHGLKQLLQEIRQETQRHEAHERRRERLRAELAGLLDCLPADMTLSLLERSLDPQLRNEIRQMKDTLRRLHGRLQAEYRATALLIRDMSRLNRDLFRAIFCPEGPQTTTYGVRGTPRTDATRALINLSF